MADIKKKKTVADPIPAYEDFKYVWHKTRAVCRGEREVKSIDSIIDVTTFNNLLIPFSPSMTQEQYNFYKAEAEWPGIVAQYAKILVGGLLRKQPTLTLPANLPEETTDWIVNEFARDGSPLIHFLDEVLWEEIQTSRAWVYVDYPRIKNAEALTTEDFKKIKPYPVLWQAESVINWKVEVTANGESRLTRVIVKGYTEDYTEDEFHADYLETVWVHELVNDKYQIRVFKKVKDNLEFSELIDNILIANKPLDFIPAWPLNGSYEVIDPMLSPLVDREISLYNKISRRNHLLYGASTYTPVIAADLSEDEFDDIVNAGLGSWIKIPSGGTATVLDTPTAALTDMDRAIASTIEDMAKLGIRMLTPETVQSGVALEIRNAAQTAQLGTLNTKVSNTFAAIIAFMISWRYAVEVKASDVKFTLSADFNPTPLGADWLRLATEWYQNGLIPRSAWILMLKQNDMLAPEYDDEEGQKEITADENIVNSTDKMDYQKALLAEQEKLNEAN